MVGEEVLSAKTILKPLSCDIISWLMDKEDWDLYMYTQFQNNVQTHTHCRASTHDTGKKANSHPNSLLKRLKNYPVCHPRVLPFHVWKCLPAILMAIGSSRAFEVLVRCGIILDVRHPKRSNPMANGRRRQQQQQQHQQHHHIYIYCCISSALTSCNFTFFLAVRFSCRSR